MTRNRIFLAIAIPVTFFMLLMVVCFTYVMTHLPTNHTGSLPSSLEIVVKVEDDSLSRSEQRRDLSATLDVIKSRATQLGIWQGERLSQDRDLLKFAVAGAMNVERVESVLLRRGHVELRPFVDQPLAAEIVTLMDSAVYALLTAGESSNDLEELITYDEPEGGGEAVPPRDALSRCFLSDSMPFEIYDRDFDAVQGMIDDERIAALLPDEVRAMLSSDALLESGRLDWTLSFVGRPFPLTNDRVLEVSYKNDGDGGGSVAFIPDSIGTDHLTALIDSNMGRRLTVCFDGRVISMPEVDTTWLSEPRFEPLKPYADLEVPDVFAIIVSGELPAPVTIVEYDYAFTGRRRP